MSENAEPTYLYHYTTAEGLKGIIEKQEIWATDIRYLNDTKEFCVGRDAFKQTIEEKLRSLDEGTQEGKVARIVAAMLDSHQDVLSMYPLHVCSFSEMEDDLSQWRAYCYDGGYTIGFPRGRLEMLGKEHGCFLNKCKYDITQSTYAVDSVLDGLRKSIPVAEEEAVLQLVSVRMVMGSFAAQFKHEAFRSEKEWRLISFNLLAPRQVRARGNFLIPYITFKLNDATLWEDAQIVVGPCSQETEELRVDSVKILLESELPKHDLPTSCIKNVRPSTIPYRTAMGG